MHCRKVGSAGSRTSLSHGAPTSLPTRSTRASNAGRGNRLAGRVRTRGTPRGSSPSVEPAWNRLFGGHELGSSALTGRLHCAVEARIRVCGRTQAPQVQHVTQLLETPDLVGGVKRAVVLSQELFMPLRRQQTKNLAGILRRPLHRLRSHAISLL